jgi:hypothetical protein
VIFSPSVKIFTLLAIVCSVPSPLDLVHGFEVELDRVAEASDEEREPLHLGEGYLQTVSLRRVLLTAFSNGRGGRCRVVGPDGKFFTEGRPAKS